MPAISVRLADHFEELTDPRRREPVYPLLNIVTIAICAVVCGADDFVSIAEYGEKKKKWLAQFLDLSAGIPSHDRFNAVFAALNPAEFERCLLSWITALHGKKFGTAVRGHWSIENRLHWQLDVTFGEDQSRIRKGHADANFSSLRRTALSLLKNNRTLKVGIKNKRLAAGWDNDYLAQVLLGA